MPAPASIPTVQKAALPSPDLGHLQEPAASPSLQSNGSHSLYNQPDVLHVEHLSSTSMKTTLQLAFVTESADGLKQVEGLILPPIEPFLPSGTDPDAAKSLSALYRSHCTSLVECIRYCKEKAFFHLYTSFQGTLTMPVQKLFGNPAVASWIEECDLILYQRMMQIVSGLTLQVVPKPVLDTLRSISEKLVPHIRESFQGQPPHVIRAKEAPATIFAALLDRALRVNLTAHAAANMLSNPANRDQMYVEWITWVRIRKVAECVPTRGMDDLVTLLVSELRNLLDPVNVPWDVEGLTIYGYATAQNGKQPGAEPLGESSGQNVLDRWVAFLASLPSHFPYASHADIVWCVERVGTAVLRDFTISQAKSFGSWWVTKCWIDEMICFMAEQGGFMKQKRTQAASASAMPQAASKEASRQGSRYSSGSDDFNFSNLSQAQPDRAPFASTANNGNLDKMGMTGDGNHDDSGIGIRTPDEDFPLDKFPFEPSVEQSLLAGAEFQQASVA
jgi:regulatory factor X, other